ncbi:hypothetical protein DS909_01375 [Phaeobacter gallaeciensis]|uniref:Uncharacterized protein n=2 Tax=Roseobacteraceae TaxID=2854170 RepID=A0A366XFC6_9RHOB|nr:MULTISPECIES: hypothetical protein [Roseobacteraceae]MBT3140557.1 hypothetical protein [Falsiruegeria litorea]MBT8169752.1 hypothetical protein [Falsiruegeria litorea]RBW62283.1 hypothetical protein DS909_01375 [Phaeobacter gallaeciensis]
MTVWTNDRYAYAGVTTSAGHSKPNGVGGWVRVGANFDNLVERDPLAPFGSEIASDTGFTDTPQNFVDLDATGNEMVSFVDLSDAPGRTNVQFRLTIDLGTGTAHNHDNSEQVTLSNVERITGTIFANYIRGDDGANHLRGAGDYDWFVATTGNDTLDGGTGQDMVGFVEWTNSARNVISDPFSTDGAPPTGAQATGVLVDLAHPSNNTNLAAGLTMTSVERVTGSGRQDVFYGDGQHLGPSDCLIRTTLLPLR